MKNTDKLVITGAAGLVGQNLVAELARQGYGNIVAIDKNKNNLAILKTLHPDITCCQADLAVSGDWENLLQGAARLFLLQAQITGAAFTPFQRNTLDTTATVLRAAKAHQIPFVVAVGSSVVLSAADDNYTRAKKRQAELVAASTLPHCTVRPTLMFGWFDPKHLGWLSRFMGKTPVFPIPGHGRYIRQPLFVLDFCRVLIWCAENAPDGKCYDIVGEEDVAYIDMIRAIKSVKNLKTMILQLPVPVFRLMMQLYGLFSKHPPFVADQLDALMAGDHFTGHNIRQTFGLTPTPFSTAIRETFCHPVYSKITLERWT